MGKNIVLLVRQEGLGSVQPEDRDFGIQMLDRLLHAVESQAIKPTAICFYTDGVKLACEGSPLAGAIQLVQGMGVRIVLCRSCLEYFGLLERVAVGEVGTMNEIVRLLVEADQTITL